MSKKQQADPETVESTETDPGVVEPEMAHADDPGHWTQSTWGVHDRWSCAYCPFDTLDGETAIAEHYRTQHAPPPPPSVEHILVYDRWGNPVKRGD